MGGNATTNRGEKMKPIFAEANGNTFLIFDCLDGTIPDLKLIHKLLIQENRDDSLILVPNGELPHLKMLVFGQDETFGEFCGNGSRAVAAYLFANYPGHEKFHLGSSTVTRKTTTIPIKQGAAPFHFEGREFFYGEALEPHLTIEGDLSDEELFDLGRKVQKFFPNGINVNAWRQLAPGKIFVKTYERGVQRLTKSCGTGSSVSSLDYLRGDGEVDVQTPGGALHISVHLEGTPFVELSQQE